MAKTLTFPDYRFWDVAFLCLSFSEPQATETDRPTEETVLVGIRPIVTEDNAGLQ